jgi:hypothetical protein
MKLQVIKVDCSDLLGALILRVVFRCVQPVICFKGKPIPNSFRLGVRARL